MGNSLGLVMIGGGARGAYQAGVLKRIGELKRVRNQGNPFPIIGAASAGAINGAALASGCNDFPAITRRVADLWSALRPEDVFRCDLLSQAQNSLVWILDLSFGGIAGGGNARSLLNAGPLRKYLDRNIDFESIQSNIKRGHLYALAVSATNYHSGKSYLFIQGRKGHPMWTRSRRVTLATEITVDHICASAAIPMVFAPVKLQTARGHGFFGDGCIRLQQPLSPVIRLGAEKLFAIGVRCEEREHQEEAPDSNSPSLAQVLGVLLNAMFLDHLTSDVEHLERLNHLIASGQIAAETSGAGDPLRPLETLVVTPSVDLTKIAAQHQRDMPYLVQYFVNGLGRDATSCADLMSYLLFTSGYTRALVEIGYQDASSRIDEIESFLYSNQNTELRQSA